MCWFQTVRATAAHLAVVPAADEVWSAVVAAADAAVVGLAAAIETAACPGHSSQAGPQPLPFLLHFLHLPPFGRPPRSRLLPADANASISEPVSSSTSSAASSRGRTMFVHTRRWVRARGWSFAPPARWFPSPDSDEMAASSGSSEGAPLMSSRTGQNSNRGPELALGCSQTRAAARMSLCARLRSARRVFRTDRKKRCGAIGENQ